jgi:hypothetical protein
MPVAKGTSKPEYSFEQKRELVERVCELYESQNATVESCCESAGISDRTFNLWVAQNAGFAERYKKAKEKQDAHYWQNIIKPLAKTSLQRLLEGEETEDVEVKELAFNGVPTKNAEGEVNTAKTVKRGKTQPNPTTVIFALKGIFPDMFADRSVIDLKTDAPQMIPVNPDQIAAIEKILNGEQQTDIHAIPGERKAQK